MSTTTFIYSLRCPISDEIRYIGKSNDPKRRYYAHLRVDKSACSHKINWIQHLLELGKKPIMEIIEEVSIDDWKDLEKYYISYYYDKGCRLTNTGIGGEGLSCGNQTSFKKGHTPWNYNSGAETQCLVCKRPYKKHPSLIEKSKTCSKKCYGIWLENNPTSGAFSKGDIPWNFGTSGYTNKNGTNNTVIHQLDKNTGKLISIFVSAAEAGRQLGIHQDSITNNILGRSKSAGGYHWKRISNQ